MIRFRAIKFIIVLGFMFSTLLLPGCSKKTDYSKSKITWRDVNQEFIKVEHQKNNAFKILKHQSNS